MSRYSERPRARAGLLFAGRMAAGARLAHGLGVASVGTGTGWRRPRHHRHRHALHPGRRGRHLRHRGRACLHGDVQRIGDRRSHRRHADSRGQSRRGDRRPCRDFRGSCVPERLPRHGPRVRRRHRDGGLPRRRRREHRSDADPAGAERWHDHGHHRWQPCRPRPSCRLVLLRRRQGRRRATGCRGRGRRRLHGRHEHRGAIRRGVARHGGRNLDALDQRDGARALRPGDERRHRDHVPGAGGAGGRHDHGELHRSDAERRHRRHAGPRRQRRPELRRVAGVQHPGGGAVDGFESQPESLRLVAQLWHAQARLSPEHDRVQSKCAL